MAVVKRQASVQRSEGVGYKSSGAEQKIDAGEIRALGGVSGYTALVVGFSLAAVFVLGCYLVAVALPLSRIHIFWVLLAVINLLGRHITLVRHRSRTAHGAWLLARGGAHPNTSRLPALYFTYVLGSGGHTGELCEVIKQSFKATPTLHRRYIVTSGDTYSLAALAKLENLIHDVYPGSTAGTWDVYGVTRARRVHQPFWTAPYTSLLSAISVIEALLRSPEARSAPGVKSSFRYPNVIVTNGPGTGFIICLVAHLLRMFWLVPENRLKIVYIETWAHMSTLSLTGKLFYYTSIADIFMVQHKKLADATGTRFVGEVAKSGNLLGL